MLTGERKQSYWDYNLEMKQNWMLNTLNSNPASLFGFGLCTLICTLFWCGACPVKGEKKGDWTPVSVTVLFATLWSRSSHFLPMLLMFTKDPALRPPHIPRVLRSQLPTSEIWELNLRIQAEHSIRIVWKWDRNFEWSINIICKKKQLEWTIVDCI